MRKYRRKSVCDLTGPHQWPPLSAMCSAPVPGPFADDSRCRSQGETSVNPRPPRIQVPLWCLFGRRLAWRIVPLPQLCAITRRCGWQGALLIECQPLLRLASGCASLRSSKLGRPPSGCPSRLRCQS
ncbi:hypothetical protein B0T16DRAFT_188082 [Cercophora newfieldiana]|uniref:Uncharacterized protein n=1 Tax=Cercophora newfieldiana TaxID=92897 RepID=A0AA39Y237_9PEZI|nr:hypothetical protein B0T16DRAFT_188082 [Cercophora newfieldiana]